MRPPSPKAPNVVFCLQASLSPDRCAQRASPKRQSQLSFPRPSGQCQMLPAAACDHGMRLIVLRQLPRTPSQCDISFTHRDVQQWLRCRYTDPTQSSPEALLCLLTSIAAPRALQTAMPYHNSPLSAKVGQRVPR
ncbi:hypothetical protein AOQ84DRAFT_40240 [Glonium stellatum]|uniref:Uncharacterized protein n=1 Tax=Glonium stellatum TaxID=574774 RepID=A0A8E2F0S0_9PEZI|nr:hypothetical protein AOQ84DRAFT_40240 [Glonium stellatum]